MFFPYGINAGAATSDFNVRPPGVVDINSWLGNGPTDKNHDGLRTHLESVRKAGIEEGATYEIATVPGVNGLDFEDGLKPEQVKWYETAGRITRKEFGLKPVILAFVGPAGEDVLVRPNYASSDDCDSGKGLDFALYFLKIAGAAGARKLVGPGPVDEHFNPDTVRLYDRWGNDLNDRILPVAEKLDVVYAPESLRKDESTALWDVERYRDYVKKVDNKRFKMHLDTAHLWANYGSKKYLKILKESIEADTVEHLHISNGDRWNTADNRGAIHENTNVGKDMKELFTMLDETGFDGSIGIEVPHYMFHGAIGRYIDGLKGLVSSYPNKTLDQFSAAEEKTSIIFVLGNYKARRAA